MVEQGENVDIGTNKTPPTYQVKLRLWPRQINLQIKVCMDYMDYDVWQKKQNCRGYFDFFTFK